MTLPSTIDLTENSDFSNMISDAISLRSPIRLLEGLFEDGLGNLTHTYLACFPWNTWEYDSNVKYTSQLTQCTELERELNLHFDSNLHTPMLFGSKEDRKDARRKIGWFLADDYENVSCHCCGKPLTVFNDCDIGICNECRDRIASDHIKQELFS